MMTKVRSADMSWREVEEAIHRGAAAIFPISSTEEHGPHAPTGDYMIDQEIAYRVAQQTQDIVFPSLPFGYSEYFRHYPGTITLQSDTLFRVVEDVITCLIRQGFLHIVIFNGHKGNEPTLSTLIRKIRREYGRLVPVVSNLSFAMTPEFTKELYGDEQIGHGGEPMGSLSLYLFPEKVVMERAEDWGHGAFLGLPTASLSGVIFEGVAVPMAIDMNDITPPSGSLSNPLVASAERGQRIVERAVERSVRFMQWFKSVDPRVPPG